MKLSIIYITPLNAFLPSFGLWNTLSQILTKEDTFILLHGFIDKSNWFITHTTGS